MTMGAVKRAVGLILQQDQLLRLGHGPEAGVYKQRLVVGAGDDHQVIVPGGEPVLGQGGHQPPQQVLAPQLGQQGKAFQQRPRRAAAAHQLWLLARGLVHAEGRLHVVVQAQPLALQQGLQRRPVPGGGQLYLLDVVYFHGSVLLSSKHAQNACGRISVYYINGKRRLLVISLSIPWYKRFVLVAFFAALC